MPIIGFLGVIVEILSYLDMISALICALVSVSEDSLLRSRLFFFWAHYILYSGSPRCRALLPAYAGGTFVNGPRKTNAIFGVACFSFGLIISYTQVPRAFALYCLLTQAEPSLMVQEKQMPPSVSLVFLLDSLFHIPKKDATKHSLRDIFLCSLIISLR